MSAPTRDSRTRRACLSQSLKAIRRLRGRRAADVARDMGMPLRSYEYFEAGQGRLNLERIHKFADVLDADALAILIGMEMCSPSFAVRCAGNKLMTILEMALQEFDGEAGDDMAQLDARTLINAFAQTFDGMKDQARERAGFLSRWIADKTPPDEGA
jgi:transcriptional regulator with XRE-family HTH domain